MGLIITNSSGASLALPDPIGDVLAPVEVKEYTDVEYDKVTNDPRFQGLIDRGFIVVTSLESDNTAADISNLSPTPPMVGTNVRDNLAEAALHMGDMNNPHNTPTDPVAVYRESEPTPVGQLKDSFSDALAYLDTFIAQNKEMFIDKSLGAPVIPTSGGGSWDLENVVLSADLLVAPTVVTIQDGAVIANQIVAEQGIHLVCDAASTPFTVASSAKVILNCSSRLLSNAGKSFLVDVQNGGVLDLTLRDKSRIDGASGQEPIKVRSGGTINLYVYHECGYDNDVFDVDAGGTINVYVYSPTSALGLTQTNMLGTLSFAPGSMWWDQNDATVSIQMVDADVILQLGQEMHTRAVNTTGSPIPNGTIVYVDGASSGNPTVAIAQADDSATADKTIGVTTHEIAAGAVGYVTTSGKVRDLNTAAFVEGDQIWLSPTVAGAFTKVRPISPNRTIGMGEVLIADAANGSVLVHVEKESRVVDSRTLYASNPPDATGFNILGYYANVIGSTALSSGAPIVIPSGSFLNDQACLVLSGSAGLPFTINLSGIRVDEATGSTSAYNEDIAVAADGNYTTGTKWQGALTISIVEGGKSTNCLVNRTRYWDNNNNDFILTGSRWQWESSTGWALQYQVSVVRNDGSLDVIDSQTIPAGFGAVGLDSTWKRTDYDTFVEGSNREGLVVEIVNVNKLVFLGVDVKFVPV